MLAAKLYRVPANLIKRNLEPERPSRSSMRDEGYDYPFQPLTMGVMAAAAKPFMNHLSDEVIVRAHRKKELWIPGAKRVPAIKHRGTFNNGYPLTLTVHFNAGRDNPEGTMDSGRKNGYLYSALGRFGEHVQSNPLSQWGYHVGKSQIKIDGKFKSGASAFSHGVEISAAGSVKKVGNGYRPWFWRADKDTLTEDQVRFADDKYYEIKGDGYFHKYTTDQEESLIRLCLWMKSNCPDVFRLELVHAHSEVAIPFGRKNDCGGALSMDMDDFRQLLLKRYSALGLK